MFKIPDPRWHYSFYELVKPVECCTLSDCVTGAIKSKLRPVGPAETHLNSSLWSSGSVIYRSSAVCWLSRSLSGKYLRMNHHKGISVFNIKCFGVLWASRKRPPLNIMAQIRHMIEVCLMEARPKRSFKKKSSWFSPDFLTNEKIHLWQTQALKVQQQFVLMLSLNLSS